MTRKFEIEPDALTALMASNEEFRALTLSYAEGVVTLGADPSPELQQLLENGLAEENVANAVAMRVAHLRRDQVRSVIAQNVGDTASILGTVADATGALLAIALADVAALSSTSSFDDYRKAKLDTLKSLSGGADIAALAGAALQQLQSGDAVLTASLKGLENVIAESLGHSTAVATILAQAAPHGELD